MQCTVASAVATTTIATTSTSTTAISAAAAATIVLSALSGCLLPEKNLFARTTTNRRRLPLGFDV